MLLPDFEIRRLAMSKGMITPFAEGSSLSPSFGLSSYGYDLRLAPRLVRYARGAEVVDPRKVREEAVAELPLEQDESYSWFTLNPADFCLGVSVERFKIPKDVLAICVGKSTYARCGLIVNVTPLEPEWEGELTLEITNTCSRPVRVYAGLGIAQLLFLRSEDDCERSYRDKQGKYQGQVGITLPR